MSSVYKTYVRPFNHARLRLQFRLQSNDTLISCSAIRGNLTIINGIFLLKKSTQFPRLTSCDRTAVNIAPVSNTNLLIYLHSCWESGQFTIVTWLQDDPTRKRDLIPETDRHFSFLRVTQAPTQHVPGLLHR